MKKKKEHSIQDENHVQDAGGHVAGAGLTVQQEPDLGCHNNTPGRTTRVQEGKVPYVHADMKLTILAGLLH
eukprot:1125845-Prorocentrum_lima.AAC.1